MLLYNYFGYNDYLYSSIIQPSYLQVLTTIYKN
ncbi:hypothetical protein Vi05172_g13712 [Venturia inaequalis]|nr:hypothetical protein Vi05172_g13712 [Venturia inaequalis]